MVLEQQCEGEVTITASRQRSGRGLKGSEYEEGEPEREAVCQQSHQLSDLTSGSLRLCVSEAVRDCVRVLHSSVWTLN